MELVLATLNARYAHASLGLRCLRANLGAVKPRSIIREFTISQRPIDIVEALLSESPRVIGLGVYIWNARESLEVVRLLAQLAPEVKLVLGQDGERRAEEVAPAPPGATRRKGTSVRPMLRPML